MREDYQTFKEDAVRELRAHWLTNRTTVKEAIIDLYQPSAADYAASKTFLSHVDSVAQLRHLTLEQSSTEDLVNLATPTADLSCSHADSLLKNAHSKDNSKEQTLSMAVCSTSSEEGSNSEESSVVGAWSPTSTDTDAAQMGDAPSTTPLCLTSPSSAGTLLGQVTAPHVDPITPLRSDSLKDSAKGSQSTTHARTQQQMTQDTTQEATPESKQGSATPVVSPTKPLPNEIMTVLTTTSATSSTSSGSSTPTSRSHAPLVPLTPPLSSQSSSPSAGSALISAAARHERDRESNRESSRERERENKPSCEGLRIILLEEANSPASSISSFETPIMIYGQS